MSATKTDKHTTTPKMAPPTEPEKQQQWTGSVLFLGALLQLLLVHLAYRIDRAKSAPYFSTASWAIAFGVALGALLSYLSPRRASHEGLDPQLLFFGLLPSIILEAGFNTKRKGFFSNFLVICLLALGGTLVATLATAGLVVWMALDNMTQLPLAEALVYGALISAIDPVATLVVLRKSHAPSLLFNLLFGESVVNDAVVIVVFGIFQNAALDVKATTTTTTTAMTLLLQLIGICVGSVLLAIVVCYASAYVLRHSDDALKQHPTYEISTMLLSAYACYVAGQSLQLSGLLAVFLSGVLIRHYHMYNVSHASAAAFTQMLSTIAFLAENFIYLYLGASLVAYSHTFRWDWRFISISFVAALVARALHIFPLCALADMCRSRTRRIPWRYMVVMWFSGLRGSIAFALALNVRTPRGSEDHAAVIRASTLVTVISTTVLFGAATGPLLHVLGLARDGASADAVGGRGREQPHEQRHDDESAPLVAAVDTLTEVDVRTGGWSVRELWMHVDETHLKPIFGGNPRVSVARPSAQQPEKRSRRPPVGMMAAQHAMYYGQLRELLTLAVPGMLSTYCFFSISLTQLSIIGHLGLDQLAAVAYSQMSMDFSTLVFMQGFNAGMNALCSQAFGAKNFHLIGQYGQLTATMLTVMCVPMALLWWNLGELLVVVGVKQQVASYARVYCRLWILGMWPRSMFQVLSIFYQSQQIVLPTTAINVVTVILNFFLATGLTHGTFGLPALGFIGCPLGTALAMWLRLGGYYYYMHVYRKLDRRTHAQWTWQRRRVWKMSNLKTLMAIGFPLAAGNLFENAQLQTMALFSAKIGEVQLGTHNSMMELFFFATSPIYGLLDASITLVGKQLGAGHAIVAQTMANIAGTCIGIVAVCTSAIFLLFRASLGRLFSDDADVVLQIEQIASLAAMGYVFLSFFCYAMIVLEAQARSVPIMIAFLAGSWGVGVPCAYFLGLCQGRTWLLGIWCGMICGYMVTSAIGFFFAHFTTDWELEAQRAVERSKEKTIEVDVTDENTIAITEATLLLPK